MSQILTKRNRQKIPHGGFLYVFEKENKDGDKLFWRSQSNQLSEKARFIELILNKNINLNRSRAAIIRQLVRYDFNPDPVKQWKDEQKRKELEMCGEANLTEDEEEKELNILKGKEWFDLYEEDLKTFLDALDAQEKKESKVNFFDKKKEKRRQIIDDDHEPDDDEFDLSMDEDERERFNQMSEKEREIEIFKRLEQRELMKTREQIKRKLEMAAGKNETNIVKRKRRLSHETDDSDNEKNGNKKNETSSDDDNIINSSKPSSSVEKHKHKSITKMSVSTADIEDEDTAYHKPSELANKYNKKMAMADLLNKRRDKKQAEEKRKKENQKAALDLDEIFGKEDGKSSSSSSPASSRSSSPVYGKSRSPSPVAQPVYFILILSNLRLFPTFRSKKWMIF
uniref:Uncharacterized protein n=1 Tax=Meloidogyne javanica TaxID=6303 RepID=A0A915LKF9_MELJA